jgi:cytochrome P450
MQSVLFRQSEVSDPFPLYEKMLESTPIYFDDSAAIWAIYGYADCIRVLGHEHAHIPDPNAGHYHLFNPIARQIADNLVRLSNPPHHHTIRPIVEQLFRQMKMPNIHELLENILRPYHGKTFDWVNVIGKQFPVLAVLAGFGIVGEDTQDLAKNVATLTKIMQPTKSPSDIEAINAACDTVYPLIERYLTESQAIHHLMETVDDSSGRLETILGIAVTNFIGLLIQSFDAGRGLLSNTLIQYCGKQPIISNMKQFVIETLRFDPPVHNTRRVLAADIELGEIRLKKGDQVLIVVAAANRDLAAFDHANDFDPLRSNNDQHLTFGAGIHDCLARHFMVDFATDVLLYVDKHYEGTEYIMETIQYEPLVNVRLPKTLPIRLSR